MGIEQNEFLIDIDIFSDEQFDVNDSIVISKAIINRLTEQDRWIHGDFEDDSWTVKKTLFDGYHMHFDFSALNSATFNKELPSNFKEIVKCWTANLIDTQTNALHSYSRFMKCFEISKGFRKDEVSHLARFIEHMECSDSLKHGIVNAACNFFDYTDLEQADYYLPALMDLSSKIPNTKNVRMLPPSKDVLAFSYYLEKHFERLLDASIQNQKVEKELLTVYPVYLWWKLTNIIPMRPSEFTSIPRNCFPDDSEKLNLRIPRIKQRNVNRVQVPGTLPIDVETYELIKHYIDITEPYGHTETLISYPSVIEGTKSKAGTYNRTAFTHKKNSFHSAHLYNLIKSFYVTLKREYGYEPAFENQVTTIHTRHFAFISLMMQGYTPVEIARLGGHSTVEAQYHYQGHSEFWIDCETFKLMKKMKGTYNVSSAIPERVKMAIDDDYNGFERKMKIGICTDEEQTCQSRKCYFCDHWRIRSDEFLQKKSIIRKEIADMKQNINELTKVLFDLNKQYLSSELNRRNPEYLTNIKTKSNQIQAGLHQLATLCQKLGKEEVLHGEISWTES